MPSKPHRGPEDPADAFDVFISFARPSGLEYAIALRAALAARGRRAFVDERDVPLGSSWAEVVEERHRWSTFTVAVITADSPGSAYQEAEVAQALAWARAPSGPSHFAYAWPCPGSKLGHLWLNITGSIDLLDYPEGATLAAAAAVVARELAVSLSLRDGREEPPEPEPEVVPAPASKAPLLPPQSPTNFPPEWAVEWGHDEQGPYASFAIKRVIQRMRWCPPGRFMMGSPEQEAGRHPDEGPQHDVSIDEGFWLADTPMTYELFGAIAGDPPTSPPEKPNTRAVERIPWEQAVVFADRVDGMLAAHEPPGPRLVVRLPTEAEWEYACRAGTTGPTCASSGSKLEDIAWFSANASGKAQPVAKLQPNAWGLFDMLGNVWEWCIDRGDFPRGYRLDKEGKPQRFGTAGPRRVARGAGYDRDVGDVRCAVRGHLEPKLSLAAVGLRICIGPPLPAGWEPDEPDHPWLGPRNPAFQS
jgi:formylglycine-generating enzyme required for sulfatase activity